MDPNRHSGALWFWPATLAGRLATLLVTLIVAATALASLLDYRQDRNLAIERARRELQAQTDLVAERLRREIHDRHRAVDLWPELEAAQDLAVDDLDRRLSASLLQLASSFGAGDQALGVDPNGTLLAASDAALIGGGIGGSAFLQRLDSLSRISSSPGAPGSLQATVDVSLFPDPEGIGLPSLGTDTRGKPVLVFSHQVLARPDGRPLGWIVLMTSWPTLVESLAQELGPELRIQGEGHVWYLGESLQDQRGPWVTATRSLGGDLPDTLQVSLRRPEAAVLAPLRGAGIRLAALAALFLLAVVPPLLLLLRATLRELAGLTRTATGMDPAEPGSFEAVSPAAPREVQVLASALSGMVERLEGSKKELARRESLAAVGMLAAGLAHEIRTPLSVLRASAEMLEQYEPSDERERELITFIQEEVARLARLVDDLLLFARPRPPDLASVKLDDVLRRTARALATEAHEGRVSIEMEASPVGVLGDAEQLYQVGLNLLGNALHLSPAGSRVHLSTHAEEGMGWLTVEDQGPGIAPENLQRIWEPLFSTRTSGTGLGLAVVKRIVQEHHGLIRVESTPGAGARFSVGFPLREGEEAIMVDAGDVGKSP